MSRPARRFAVLAVLLGGLQDLVPLYAVYVLLFAAEGMSDAAISGLFLLWSLTSFAAEVPSGALADLRSRRLLLAVGSLLTAAGFALWVLVPTFAGFAAGFALWGIGGALASGTWQSLVYDALSDLGAADRYAGVMGGSECARWLAAVAAAALATPLLAWGGFALVAWASIAVTLLHAGLALLLPSPPRTGVDPDGLEDPTAGPADRPAGVVPAAVGGVVPATAPAQDTSSVRGAAAGYVATLTAGLREAALHPRLRRGVLLLALLTGLLAFDEYLPLVAAGTGVRVEVVPLLMTLTFLAQAVGTALAGVVSRLPEVWPERLLGLGALLIGGGALSGHPLGFAVLGVGYALATCVLVVLDARLQDAITGRSRATVSSAVGLGSELVAVALFATYAGASLLLPVALLVALNALPLLAVSAWLRRGH